MFEAGDFIIFKCIDQADSNIKRYNNQFALVTDQTVEIDEEVGEMFHLIFGDGFETDAFCEEIEELI